MGRTVSTVLVESDFEGNIWDTHDCVGYRSFKRAYNENTGWFRKSYNYINSWGITNGDVVGFINIQKWSSFKDGKLVDMMYNVRIGDKIDFVRK